MCPRTFSMHAEFFTKPLTPGCFLPPPPVCHEPWLTLRGGACFCVVFLFAFLVFEIFSSHGVFAWRDTLYFCSCFCFGFWLSDFSRICGSPNCCFCLRFYVLCFLRFSLAYRLHCCYFFAFFPAFSVPCFLRYLGGGG